MVGPRRPPAPSARSRAASSASSPDRRATRRRPPAPCASSSTACGAMSKTTHSWPALISRRTMFRAHPSQTDHSELHDVSSFGPISSTDTAANLTRIGARDHPPTRRSPGQGGTAGEQRQTNSEHLSIFCAARCLLRFPLLPGEDEGEVMSSGRAAPDSGEATATRICAVAGTEGSRVVRSPHPGPLLEGEGARAPIRENRQSGKRGRVGEGVISISIAIPISSSIPEPPPRFATAPARRPQRRQRGRAVFAVGRVRRNDSIGIEIAIGIEIGSPLPACRCGGGSETPIACGLSIFCAARCLLRFPLLPGEDEGEVMSSGRAAPDSGEATATRICAVAGTEGSRVVGSPHPGPLLEGEGARAPIRENRQSVAGEG